MNKYLIGGLIVVLGLAAAFMATCKKKQSSRVGQSKLVFCLVSLAQLSH